MARISIGAPVRHMVTGRVGALVASPHGHRAPRGMRWVLFNGDDRPKLAVLHMLQFVATRREMGMLREAGHVD
jgi:hypothetical protein